MAFGSDSPEASQGAALTTRRRVGTRAASVCGLVAALAMVGSPRSAQAHGIAGNRFFPGTITFDDPAVADEFLLAPSSRKNPDPDPIQLNWIRV